MVKGFYFVLEGIISSPSRKWVLDKAITFPSTYLEVLPRTELGEQARDIFTRALVMDRENQAE